MIVKTFFIPALVLLTALWLPNDVPEHRAGGIRCVSVRYDWPLTPQFVPWYPDHNIVCYSGDLVLYSLYAHYDSTSGGVKIKDGVWSYYFVYRKGERTGVLYDLDHGTRRTRIAVDSINGKQWFDTFDANDYFKNKYELVSTVRDEPHGGFTETYRVFIDTLTARIVVHYRDEYRDVPFSFSPTLDSVKHSKLCGLELYVYSPQLKPLHIDSARAAKVPFSTYEFDEVDSADKVRPFFERYIVDAAGGH
jgi:hypothetical protein